MFHFGLLIVSHRPQSTPIADPNRLAIGRSGTVIVRPGELVDTKTGKAVDLAAVASAAKDKPFVFLGEQHATKLHQEEEAAIVNQLASAGRSVSVGLEMFTRPKQDVLDQWSSNSLSEADFIEKSDWKHQWGFDYGFYRPVFEVVRTNHLPLVALNVPRDWVHTVATSGYACLPTSAKLQLPTQLFLGNTAHREVFDSLMGGHASAGGGMDGMYAAQVLWDEGMADTAIKFEGLRTPDKKNVFVVIAGSGHVMYGQGINYRVGRRHAGDGISVVMLSSDQPLTVAKGIADFVFVSPAAP